MQQKSHWMVRFVRIVALLFVLSGSLMVFFYTPWYSTSIVYLLNRFVAVELNEVAAESQRAANLTEQQSLEPGSELWIARQAYLKVLERNLKQDAEQDLVTIVARYRKLQKLIEEEQDKAKETVKPTVIPHLAKPVQYEVSSAASEVTNLSDLLALNSSEQQELMEKYETFLQSYPLHEEAKKQVDVTDLKKELALLENEDVLNHQVSMSSQPNAIVVLGGGLTFDEHEKNIIVNDYTRLRLEKILELKKHYDLPIVLSGVEAPYMQKWLEAHHVEANLLEARSMNTCENSRFSSLLLQKQGGAPTVLLVTDRYHLPRTRRLFALNGIQTIPIEAPMPHPLTSWMPAQKNYDHSRRANYELLATLRDIWFGSSDCREVP